VAQTRRIYSSVQSRASSGFGRPSVRYEGCRVVDLGIKAGLYPAASKRNRSFYRQDVFAVEGTSVKTRNTHVSVTFADWAAAFVSLAVAFGAIVKQAAAVSVAVTHRAVIGSWEFVSRGRSNAQVVLVNAPEGIDRRTNAQALLANALEGIDRRTKSSVAQASQAGHVNVGVPGQEVIVRSARGFFPPPFVPRVRTAAEIRGEGVAVVTGGPALPASVIPQMNSGNFAGPDVAVLVGGAETPAPPAPHTRGSSDLRNMGDVMIPRPPFGRLTWGERVANPAPLSIQMHIDD